MDTENIRLRWEQEEAAVRQRIEAGGGRAGVSTPEQIAGKTGLEIMQALLRGASLADALQAAGGDFTFDTWLVQALQHGWLWRAERRPAETTT